MAGRLKQEGLLKLSPGILLIHIRYNQVILTVATIIIMDFHLRSMIINAPTGNQERHFWVRETFALDEWFYLPGHKEVLYKTDNIDSDYPVKWKPSIHMPKWACRIWLEIINIKVEKLQDIRMSDCEAEGAKDYLYGEYPNSYNIKKAGSCLRHNFHRLWDSINEKKHPWASNPWVWGCRNLKGLKMKNKPRKPLPGEIEAMFAQWVINWIIILQDKEKNE